MRERVIYNPPAGEPAAAPTVPLVPLTDLTDLARLGAAVRKAQRAYFDAKKARPHVKAEAEWRAVIDLERRFDAAVADALARERRPLPGMEGGAPC